jgi:hypothetical protein
MGTRRSVLVAVVMAAFVVIAISPIAVADDEGAPKNATYILQTPNRHLKREQALSQLPTGLLKNTTGTGVLSIATPGADYATPGQVQDFANAIATLQGLVATLQAQVTTLQGQQATTNSAIALLQSRLATVQSDVTTIQTSNAQALNECVSVSHDTLNGLIGPHVLFTGCNVHIRSGSGRTDDFVGGGGTLTGLGNLIVGYNEEPEFLPRLQPGDRAGSHNFVLGLGHRFLKSGGLVAGLDNTVSGRYASVSAGFLNTASGDASSVSGGFSNTASEANSTVSGGSFNKASGNLSGVSGGVFNTASGDNSFVSGGAQNTASGANSTVSGGRLNTASGDFSSVSGGERNTASGENSSVSGGKLRSAANIDNWAAGALSEPN